MTVSLVAIALCLLGPAEHAEGERYYRYMDSTLKTGGNPTPEALTLSAEDVNALNRLPANKAAAAVAAINPDAASYYHYDSNHDGACHVITGLSTGAKTPCNIHPLARPNVYGGRRPAHPKGKRHVFEIDDAAPAGYWPGLELNAIEDNKPMPGHASIFINDDAADVKRAGNGKTVPWANGKFRASAQHWAPILPPPHGPLLPGPCIQANALWIAAPAIAGAGGAPKPQIALPVDNQDPTHEFGAYQGYGGNNVLVENPCDLGPDNLPAAYGGISANHVWSLPARTLPAITAHAPGRYGVWQYAPNNNILYPIYRDFRHLHNPRIQNLGWVQVAACPVGLACCPLPPPVLVVPPVAAQP